MWLLWLLEYKLSATVAMGFMALAGVASEIGVVMLVYFDCAVAADGANGVLSVATTNNPKNTHVEHAAALAIGCQNRDYDGRVLPACAERSADIEGAVTIRHLHEMPIMPRRILYEVYHRRLAHATRSMVLIRGLVECSDDPDATGSGHAALVLGTWQHE
ncbi:MAG: hypothetical protein ACRESE_00790 [Gammaproteobacteria bacterium]